MQPGRRTPMKTFLEPNITMKEKNNNINSWKAGLHWFNLFHIEACSTRLRWANEYEMQLQMRGNLLMPTAWLVLIYAAQLVQSGFQNLLLSLALVWLCLPSLLDGHLENAFYSHEYSWKLVVPSSCVCRHLGQLSHCLWGPLKLDYRRRESIRGSRAVCPGWDTSAIFSPSFISKFRYFWSSSHRAKYW